MQVALFSTSDTSHLPPLGFLSKGDETLDYLNINHLQHREKEQHGLWSTFLLLYCKDLYSPLSWKSALATEAYSPEILEKIIPLSRPSPAFETYMKLVNTWARAFDEEAIAYATEDLESLYDDAYFEAMELQKELP